MNNFYLFMVCIGWGFSAGVAAEELLRLFTTPELRRELDQVRNRPPPTPEEVRADVPEPPKPPPFITFNGVIKRSDGKVVVWVNGAERTQYDEYYVDVQGLERGALPVILNTEAHPEIYLKPGQTVATEEGKVYEYVPSPAVPDL